MTQKNTDNGIPSWATHYGFVQPWDQFLCRPRGKPVLEFFKATSKRYYRGEPRDGADWWPNSVGQREDSFDEDGRMWQRRKYHPRLILDTVQEITDEMREKDSVDV